MGKSLVDRKNKKVSEIKTNQGSIRALSCRIRLKITESFCLSLIVKRKSVTKSAKITLRQQLISGLSYLSPGEIQSLEFYISDKS